VKWSVSEIFGKVNSQDRHLTSLFLYFYIQKRVGERETCFQHVPFCSSDCPVTSLAKDEVNKITETI